MGNSSETRGLEAISCFPFISERYRTGLFGTAVLLLLGCTQSYEPLTPEGETLGVIHDPSSVKGCRILGKVKSIGLTGELNSFRHAMNLTRNRLAEHGATHLSILNSKSDKMATVILAKGWHCRGLRKLQKPGNVNKGSWIIIE